MVLAPDWVRVVTRIGVSPLLKVTEPPETARGPLLKLVRVEAGVKVTLPPVNWVSLVML